MTVGTITFTEYVYNSVRKVKAVWVSASDDGTATATTTNYYDGRFIGLITVPGVTGLQPSDNYTVKVKDTDGVDLLLAAATSNRDEINTEFVKEADMAGVSASKLTFAISGAGNSKGGTIYLLIR